MFTHDESVRHDIFTKGGRETINVCDVVKRIPRDCLYGIGIGIDGIFNDLRMCESELAFKRMSEVSSGYSKNSREASSAVDGNLVHSMCQEIVSSTLNFPDPDINNSSPSSTRTFDAIFKKPTIVTSNSGRQLSKSKDKQNSSKKSASLCRKTIEDLVKTLTSNERYNN